MDTSSRTVTSNRGEAAQGWRLSYLGNSSSTNGRPDPYMSAYV